MPAVIFIDRAGKTTERGCRRRPQPTQMSKMMIEHRARWVVVEDRDAGQQWGVINGRMATGSKRRGGRMVMLPHTRVAQFADKDAAVMWALMQDDD